MKIVLRILLLLSVIVAPASNAADPDPKNPQPSQPIQAFLTWRDSVGLKNTFSYKGEERQENTFALTLYGGNIENVLGVQSADALYTNLFTKLLTFLDVNPANIELRVEIRDGGYCNAAIVRKTIKLNSKGIAIVRKKIKDPQGRMCALNFEAIRRYEEATKKAANDASSSTPNLAPMQSKVGISANIIQSRLTEKYTKRGASILVTGKTDNWLSIVVRKLRDEVLTGRKYWERVQLFVFLEPLENATRVRLIVDGKYAAGLAPPDDLGHIDMEPTYTANLSEYGQALVLYISEVE